MSVKRHRLARMFFVALLGLALKVWAIDPNPPPPPPPPPFEAIPKYLVTKAHVRYATVMLCALSVDKGSVI